MVLELSSLSLIAIFLTSIFSFLKKFFYYYFFNLMLIPRLSYPYCPYVMSVSRVLLGIGKGFAKHCVWSEALQLMED